MEIIAWLGSLMLAFCGLPQMLQSIKDGHSNGINWGFLLMWAGGEILTLAYIIPKADWPLIFNYSANLCFLLVIIKYKLFPRN